MFMNEPDPDVEIDESLRMGGVHTVVRKRDDVTHVWTIMIVRLEPEPPIYQVTHVQFREPRAGEREHLGDEVTTFDDLNQALLHLVEAVS